ncbi:MAG: YHS domain-containing protein [Chloroflexota bacterium]|nr:YHS domain-containing protein [Chloroflexota bacterium]
METGTKRMVTNPMCGMQVDPDHAAGTSEYNGQTVSCCSPGCTQPFDRAPEWFVGLGPR